MHVIIRFIAATAERAYALRRKSEARTRSRNCSGVSVGGAGAGFTTTGAAGFTTFFAAMSLNDQVGQPFGIAGGQQTVFTAGLNWYVNNNIMFKLNYLHGSIDKTAFAINANNANLVPADNVAASS
jgi:phosphate-selective porin